MRLTTKKRLFLLSFGITILVGCDNVKDRTIIDGIILGETEEKTYSQMDSLGIKEDVFYTQGILSLREQAVKDNVINVKYSESLDLNAYKDREIALIYPKLYINTENIIGISLIFARVENPYLIGATREILDMKLMCLEQYFIKDYINDIEQLLTEKYGEPKSKRKESQAGVYTLQENEIKRASFSNIDYACDIVEWETPDMMIKLNKGIKLNFRVYIFETNSLPITGGYMEYFDLHHKLEENEVVTYSYPYLSYELKDEKIKKMKLDKIDVKL